MTLWGQCDADTPCWDCPGVGQRILTQAVNGHHIQHGVTGEEVVFICREDNHNYNDNNKSNGDDDDDDDDDIIIIIIIMIMIIALKGAFRDFYNLLTAPGTVSNTYAQVSRAQSCANYVQHIERLSRATCSVPLGTKGQLSY